MILFHDASNNNNQDAAALVNIIEDKKNYSSRDYYNASLGIKIQNTIGQPNLEPCVNIFETQGGLANCPITIMDIMDKSGILKRETI